jgi:SAM-dependent methyltransferase
MPVHVGSLWTTAEQAKNCPRGDMSLCHCRACQLIFNAAFVPRSTEYAQDYDNSLEGSAVFMDYATSLAQRLIEGYDLHEKTVVELGCGKGAFIGLLCKLGPNVGIGFDTTYDESAANPAPGRLTFVKAHFSPEQTKGGADLVACRHVFEHIPEPFSFLQALRRSLGDRTDIVLYFEVPEVLFILRDLSIWDIIYEHCNYFGHESLGDIFARAGFEILNLRNSYHNQFLSVEARPKAGTRASPPEVPEALRLGNRVAEFTGHFRARQAQWREELARLTGNGSRVTIWAAGAKTVSFMNLFQVADQIDCIVDINPRKHGMFLPGTGQEILAPEALRDRRPDTVIIMNALYEEEIAAHLAEMDLHPKLLCA